ncbi:glutamate decarboxylase 1-like, partial [Neolamprologus brichardi]|uniref:glutamate decarboxylase 1-like n=1 Tax=Neolamprologus brichardi TaxID=32507 RepID=UPI001643BD53
ACSVTWNPHKMMGVPLQCSAILVKKRGLLQECNKLGAQYLFQTDKPYDVSYDTGDKSIQCGRHVDVFKLWLMWKAKGSDGFGSQVNKCLENAEYLYDQLQKRTEFELVFKNKPEHSNVCFWYIPPSLRSLPPGPDRDRRLHQKITNMMDPADIPEELSEELERLPRVAFSHQWVYRLKDCVHWLDGYGREGTTPPAVSATCEGVGPPGSPETGAPCPGISSGHKDLLSHAVSDAAATSATRQASALGSRAD